MNTLTNIQNLRKINRFYMYGTDEYRVYDKAVNYFLHAGNEELFQKYFNLRHRELIGMFQKNGRKQYVK